MGKSQMLYLKRKEAIRKNRKNINTIIYFCNSWKIYCTKIFIRKIKLCSKIFCL